MRNVLMGSRPFFAPNDDQGAEFDDADADELETPEPAGDGDEELDDEDADEPDADEPEADEDLDPVEEPQRQTGRRSASDEIRELRRRAQEAERRAQEAEVAVRTRQSEEAQRREQERRATMTPDELLREDVSRELQQIRFQSWDANDRVAFETLANGNSAISGIKDEVEATFQQMAAQGRPTDRKTIAAYLIGQKALERAPAAKRKGQRAAEASRQRNSARPASGRGDVAQPRQGRRQASLYDRLKDLDI
jgi:hypothetical protein